MAEKKMTKKDYFVRLYDIVNDCNVEDGMDLKLFINHELELLERKNSSRSVSPKQKENLGIMEQIKETLYIASDPLSITELQENNSDLKNFSCQKLSALLHQLIEKGEVVRVMDKRKAYYRLAD